MGYVAPVYTRVLPINFTQCQCTSDRTRGPQTAPGVLRPHPGSSDRTRGPQTAPGVSDRTGVLIPHPGSSDRTRGPQTAPGVLRPHPGSSDRTRGAFSYDT